MLYVCPILLTMSAKKSFELLTLFNITFEDVCGKWIAHEVHGNKCQIFFCREDVLFARFT